MSTPPPPPPPPRSWKRPSARSRRLDALIFALRYVAPVAAGFGSGYLFALDVIR